MNLLQDLVQNLEPLPPLETTPLEGGSLPPLLQDPSPGAPETFWSDTMPSLLKAFMEARGPRNDLFEYLRTGNLEVGPHPDVREALGIASIELLCEYALHHQLIKERDLPGVLIALGHEYNNKLRQLGR